MVPHLKIFGLLINLIFGSTISLYIFQIYKKFNYPYLRAIGFYTLLFNIAYLFLFFYSYLSVNVQFEIFSGNPHTTFIIIELIISCFSLLILFTAYVIYLGFIGKKLKKEMKLTFIFVLLVVVFVYLWRVINIDNDRFLWLDYCFDYVFENILLVEIILFSLLLTRKRNTAKQIKISRVFAIMYISRYFILFSLLIINTLYVLNENTRAIIGFSFLLILNLLPILWIKYFFIPFAHKNITSIEGNILEEYCLKYNISQREKEILRLIMAGKSNKEISNTLFISYSTVKNHIYNLFQKINISSRFELITSFNTFHKK